MTIGCRVGIIASSYQQHPIMLQYDVSVPSSLYSDLEKTTNSVLDGVVRVIENNISENSYDAVADNENGIYRKDSNYDALRHLGIIMYTITSNDFIAFNTTMFYVFKVGESSNAHYLMDNIIGGLNSNYLVYVNVNRVFMRIIDDNGGFHDMTTTTFNHNTKVVACSQLVLNTSKKLWLNNSLVSSTILPNMNPAQFNKNINIMRSVANLAENLLATHYEFRLYNGVLTNNSVNDIINELKTKWGIS